MYESERKATIKRPRANRTMTSAARLLKTILAVAVIMLSLVLVFGLKRVQAYEGCLLVSNGTIKEEWGAGLHWRFLPTSNVACYRTSRTTYEASPGKAGGGAEFNDDPVDARSKDGQKIDAVSFRIAFHVPLELTGEDGTIVQPNNLRFIYSEVGARNEDALVSSVVTFIGRPEVRTVMQLHTGEELLQGHLSIIATEIADRLRPKYAMYGVVLDDVLLSKPDFNDEFEGKLQQKQQAVIDIDIKRQQALQAEQDGQARINAANADAQVAGVQAEAEAARSVTIANANATVVAIAAEAEASRTIAQANADGTAISIRVAAFGGPESYLLALEIEAMTNWPVQIIGDGETLPVMQIAPPTASPAADQSPG